ncbi:hypothetical protein E3N88_40125 [Mikania micrantha]|uniref:Uncharacterized protein n=1 Tax=Mikania micrantha TaxID=192012 RepID=A0A5N6LP07_9ASTR|nr:hypothetical protein E3N88_40125 [Mikania micrantha]
MAVLPVQKALLAWLRYLDTQSTSPELSSGHRNGLSQLMQAAAASSTPSGLAGERDGTYIENPVDGILSVSEMNRAAEVVGDRREWVSPEMSESMMESSTGGGWWLTTAEEKKLDAEWWQDVMVKTGKRRGAKG